MSTATLPKATGTPAELTVDGRALVVEIERYLAARTRATAHPLVTKTTAQLVAEALAELPAPAPVLEAPPRILRRLPDWVLALPLFRSIYGGGRELSVAEHLELTALVIERFGWTQGAPRSQDGERCILGAQYALLRLGYGTPRTLTAATEHLCRVAGGSYVAWNDHPDRSRDEVLALVRAAAQEARA